jgi:hypothetical protein
MSGSDLSDTERRAAGLAPGLGDLGAFRGRSVPFGPPVLPPGWRPDHDDVRPTVVPPAAGTVPVARPPSTTRVMSPPAGSPPDATVVPARDVRAEVRIVRRIRPWSVWKLSLAFSICMVAVVASAGVIIWAVAAALGVLDNVEGFVTDLGFDDFTLHGGAMLRALVVGGVLASVAASVMALVLTSMFNLLSDLTGGVEAELAPKRAKKERRRGRRVRRRRAGASAEEAGAAIEPEPVPAAQDDPSVAVAAVEVAGRNGRPVVDLTGDPEWHGADAEVDRIQLELEELLADPPPQWPDRRT